MKDKFDFRIAMHNSENALMFIAVIFGIVVLAIVILLIFTAQKSIIDETVYYCTSQDTGVIMSFEEAKTLIKEGECSAAVMTGSYFCNEATGTWWIEVSMPGTPAGCSPACVVDVNAKTAEINWRCTGLV